MDMAFVDMFISGDWKNVATNIIKPTQIGINRNKYTFANIIGAPTNFKNQTLRFCQFLSKLLKYISRDRPFNRD